MMKTKHGAGLAVAFLAVVAVAAFGWWWLAKGAQQALVSESLPALPDLSVAPTTMRDRITAADTRAKSRTGAEDGMIELAQLYHANGFLDDAMSCYAGLERLQPDEPRW